MPCMGNASIYILHAEVDILRENKPQGRAFEDLESPDGAVESRRGVELEASLLVLTELLLDREELSLLWLADRSVMVGRACPSHRQSCNGSGSNVLGGGLCESAFALPAFLLSFFSFG